MSWDHPHVCGEKFPPAHRHPCSAGSPPRVRGKAGHCLVELLVLGITPACAGKSLFMMSRRRVYSDHPRVCGEKGVAELAVHQLGGSPPRVRGKGVVTPPLCAEIRITPACAGKSNLTILCSRSAKDHPRVCGEKVQLTGIVVVHKGSPPRVRGKGQ